MYGKVLSDVHLLSEIETELVVVSALHVMNAPNQLRGHVKGALNVGVTNEQLHTLLALVRAITAPLHHNY